jgi:hypothetical protein
LAPTSVRDRRSSTAAGWKRSAARSDAVAELLASAERRVSSAL